MTVIINGQIRKFEKALTLRVLVEQLCKNPQQVIAEVNGSIVKNERWANCELNEGDNLELVNFVGGG